MRKLNIGLLIVLNLICGSLYGRSKVPYNNIKKAEIKINRIHQDLIRIVEDPSSHGNPMDRICRVEVDRRHCLRYSYCEWNSRQCVLSQSIETNINENNFNENDALAEVAVYELVDQSEQLSHLIFDLAESYNSRRFFLKYARVCNRIKILIIGNQGAMAAAALPPMGLYRPEFFEDFELEFKESKELLQCR